MPRFGIFLFLLLWTRPALAQTPADLFNAELLQEIRLDVHPQDWQQLKATFLENTYYPADMRWLYNGKYVEVPQVGIRSRGTGSRHPVKPGLRVDINRYNSQHRFLGLRTIVLRNNVQDASMLHERMSFALMQRLGILTPRLAHTRLYVNNEYVGLYTVVENIDEEYLRTRYEDESGFLYEYDYGRTDLPYFFEYRGPDPALYSPKPFQPETHEGAPQVEKIVSFIRTMNQSSATEFESAIAEYLDLRTFAQELAAEAYVAELDGIVGDYGLNNFFLYRQTNSNRFLFLPWDKSQTFTSANRPSRAGIDSNVLSRRAFAIPFVLEAFKSALAATALRAGGAGGFLEQEILRAYNQIANAAREDPYKQCDPQGTGAIAPCSNEEFEAGVANMIQFARERYLRIQRELADTSAPAMTTGYQSFHIPDRGAAVFVTGSSSSAVNTAHGYVEAAPGSALPAGLAILGFKKGSVVVTETAFPARPPLRAGRILVDIGFSTTTAVAIANANSKPVDMTFHFTDQDGRDFGHGSTAIIGGGQLAVTLDQPPFNAGASLRGTFSFTASLPVGIQAFRVFSNERSEALISATPIGDVFSTASPSPVVPHFSNGAGWSTEVQLVNLDDAINQGTIEFRTANRTDAYPYTIPPRASARISLDSIAGSGAGSIRLTAADRLPVMGAILSFKPGAVTVTQTMAPSVAAGSTFRMYVEEAEGLNSSLAFANTGSLTATVRVDVTGLSGAPTGLSGTLTVPADGHAAAYLNQLPGLQTLPSNFKGVLHISSSAAIYPLGFGSRTNTRGEYLAMAIPPIENHPGASYLSLPHLADSGGYETRIIFLGTGTSTAVDAVFNFRNAVGELVDLGLD